MTVQDRKWEKGYVMLPCFTVMLLEGTHDLILTCNKFLQWVFEIFFAPFWDGGVHIWEEDDDET